jgi:hypothetical protein
MMSDDLFIRSLQGAGLVHDAELFLSRFRSRPGEFRLAIIADGADETWSAEAMIPALRYLSREHIGVVILAGLHDRAGSSVPSFRERLAGLSAIDRVLAVDPETDWTDVVKAVPTDAIAALDVAGRGGRADAPAAMRRLHEIGCRKIVVLDAQGILCRDGEPVGIVALPEDFQDATWIARVEERQRPAVQFALEIAVPAESLDISVSLASPINMLAELFTVRGSGTLFRPQARFDMFQTPNADRERGLCDVVERAFERTLVDRAFASARNARGIVEAQHRAAALLIPTALGDYMSKFAVIREAQGTGIGAELWAEICAISDKLFWRSRSANPVNSWYARVAEGMIRDGGWVFFWRGLPVSEVEAARQLALNLPEDFEADG